MGLFIQKTYELHGSHWQESLFYSHFLGLPLFIPFYRSLLSQTRALLSSPPLFVLSLNTHLSYLPDALGLIKRPLAHLLSSTLILFPDRLKPYFSSLPPRLFSTIVTNTNNGVLTIQPPRLLVALLANAITQYVCIRGVNLLAARASALTVTIVLNIRKLVSLLLSVWLFDHILSDGVVLGAAIVFASGALYAWEGQRLSREVRERRLKGE